MRKFPKQNLSKKGVVKAIEPGDTRYMIWDEKTQGLGLDVWPSGKKSWILFYRIGATQRRITLGTADRMAPAQAIKAMHAAMAKVGVGTDPLVARRNAGATPAKGATVDDVAGRYFRSLSITGSARWAKEALRYYDTYIKTAIGKRPIRETSVSDVRELHEALSRTPVSANRMKAVLSAIVARAEQDGERDEDSTNPAGKIKNYKETQRDRYLKDREWPRMAKAIRDLRAALADTRRSDTRPQQLDAVILLALTGARVGAVLPRCWSDLDNEESILRIQPPHKGAKSIYLGNSASAFLRQLRARSDGSSQHIFPGQMRRKGTRVARKEKDLRDFAANSAISGLAPMWKRAEDGISLTTLAQIEDFTLHDWRRTFATVGGDVGVSEHMISGLLSHKVKGVTGVYARRTDKALLVAASSISAEVARRLELDIAL